MMKKILYILIAAFVLSACSEDISEYTTQADGLRDENAEKQKEIKEKLEKLEAEKRKAALLKQKLDSLEKVKSGMLPEPLLMTMEFTTADNKDLSKDAVCVVHSNGIVDCWLPSMQDSKMLVPRFTFEGTLVAMDNTEVVSGSTQIDFKEPVVLSVMTSKDKKDYTVYVHSYTGLPVMRIDTENGVNITSKEEYVVAHMKLTEDVVTKTRGAGDVVEANLRIRGRGNSTWGLPKKPYRLKFDEKVSLLGEHKDKDWVLLANYSDKSMLRNHLAFAIGKMSNLDWTPSSHFVEVVLNGRYDGTYQLVEKVEISNHRVAVGDDGFILEVEARAPQEEDSRFFMSDFINYAIDIKEPDVEYDDENYNYAVNFVKEAENCLFSGNFDLLWSQFFDINSFVDWYLIHEIAKNEDSMFHFSCYMNLKRNGKLSMGPIWDFDIAFGNVKEDNTTAMLPEGLMLDWSAWYTRLMQDSRFVAKLKSRYDYFYSHKAEIMNMINNDAWYLRLSVQENQNRWGTWYHYTYKQWDIWGSYQNEVQSLKTWLNTRMEWLKKEFDKM